ncbi:GlsB/YeaQ/YmgE family stress response membrane protein [Arthrobacter sp. A5]|uniref:GlsB/YeaQ/YmgE family stress response membrane protein n=1 Tax=Arthrobacter sp. A5 TaxID=576926 RepID=UPI003DA8DF2D
MGFFAFLVLGLIAGAVAKLILPGRQGGGIIITMIVGVIGALLGGWLGGLVFGAHLQSFFSLQTWLLAIGGSVVFLLVWGLITRRLRK